jgi:predicted enzyme related to lactoylglutathione lyase
MAYWVDHVVYNLKDGLKTYEEVFGWKPSHVWEVPDAGIDAACIPIGPLPGGFAVGGSAIEMIALRQPNPAPQFEEILKKRGEGFGMMALHCDEYGPELSRLNSLGVRVDEKVLVGHKDYWVSEEFTNGVLVEYGGAGGIMELFFTRGFQKNVVDPNQVPKSGFIIRLGHKVHVVKDLDQALQTYERVFRWKPCNRWEFPDANVKSAFCRIEPMGVQLVQPTRSKGIIAETLEEIGEGIAYAVLMTDNLKAFVELMKAKGIETPESTIGGKPVAWVPRKYCRGMLFQVIEPKDYFSYFTEGKLYEV